MKKFFQLIKFLKIILLVTIFSLSAFSVYNDFLYSRCISMPAAAVLSEPVELYQNIFSFSEEQPDTFHKTFFNLCGKHYLGQLSLPADETIVVKSDSLSGSSRLLIAGNSPDSVAYDALISTTQDIHLEAGSYLIYLLGSWFTGRIEIQHGTGPFLSISTT